MRLSGRLFLVAACILSSLGWERASAQFMQQGNKIVGTGAVGAARQGSSVSLSSDGNTALIGGSADDSNGGAAWIFTRSGGVWSQQGTKLSGTGAVGKAEQGFSVSLSSDGNTAVIGGWADSNNTGAAWVFTRSGGAWSQQGTKLVGGGAVGSALQGWSVAISADGNTVIVGGYADSSLVGAAWVYKRNGTSWAPQAKLVGSGTSGIGFQGSSVALSADGNTALLGGIADSNGTGATWVFTRTGSAWSQQGAKLVGTGDLGGARQGFSVALSADGNTAVVGGFADNGDAGAVWIFTRSGGTWSQQGGKLVGTGAVGNAEQGSSVSISANGNTVAVGGPLDSSYAGAAWIFIRTGTAWSQQGTKLVGTGTSGSAQQGSSVALSGDGNTAILGGSADYHLTGAVWAFFRNGMAVGDPGTRAPQSTHLEQNYPNPFNPTTVVSYQLSRAGEVRLAVYDLLGKEVAVLVNGKEAAGSHAVRFSASLLPTGLYVYRLEAAGNVISRKMLLLR